MSIYDDPNAWLQSTIGASGDGTWTAAKLPKALKNDAEWALLEDDLGLHDDEQKQTLRDAISNATTKRKHQTGSNTPKQKKKMRCKTKYFG